MVSPREPWRTMGGIALIPLLYFMHSIGAQLLWTRAVDLEVNLELSLAYLSLASLTALCLAAWRSRNYVSVGFVTLLLLVLPYWTALAGDPSYVGSELTGSFYGFAPTPSAIFLYLMSFVAVEWSLRRREMLLDFLRSDTGKFAAAAGVVHLVFSILMERTARYEYVYHPPDFIEYYRHHGDLLGSISMAGFWFLELVFIHLWFFAAAFAPVFLWSQYRLKSPAFVAAVAVAYGVVERAVFHLFELGYPLAPLTTYYEMDPAVDYGVQIYWGGYRVGSRSRRGVQHSRDHVR